MAEQALDRFFAPNDRRKASKNFQAGAGGRWRDSGGRVHEMAQMELGYLKNALAWAMKNGWTGKAEQLREVIAAKEA